VAAVYAVLFGSGRTMRSTLTILLRYIYLAEDFDLTLSVPSAPGRLGVIRTREPEMTEWQACAEHTGSLRDAVARVVVTKNRSYAAAGTAMPSCSQVGAISETVARCMSRGQRKSS
jgi:hypothetical protein